MKLQWLPVPSPIGGWVYNEYNGFDRFAQIRGTIKKSEYDYNDNPKWVGYCFESSYHPVSSIECHWENSLETMMLEIEELIKE